MSKVKVIVAAIAVCIGFASCRASRTGPGRPYKPYTRYHASIQSQPGNCHNNLV